MKCTGSGYRSKMLVSRSISSSAGVKRDRGVGFSDLQLGQLADKGFRVAHF